MPARSIIRASSRVVRATSTSGTPAAASSSRATSNFLAVQGMMPTTKMSLGSSPIRLAYQVLVRAPNICWGDLQVERFSTNSG